MSLRDKMKAALTQRTEESYSRKDQSGKFKNIFRADVPDLKMWKVAGGEHIIDIIPYIAGANDPHVSAGEATYGLEVWVHNRVGANEDTYICLARTFNQPCPICEEQNRLRGENADEELIKALKPGRRMLYNILCYDSAKEEEKGIQVWDSSHWLFERLIVPLAKKPRRAGGGGTGYVSFSDPDEGKSIRFEKTGEKMSTDFIGHQFLDRDYVIPDEVLDAAKVLDDIIHIPTYEEVSNAFFAGGHAEAPATPPTETVPTRTPRVPAKEEEAKVEEPATTRAAASTRLSRSAAPAKVEEAKVEAPPAAERPARAARPAAPATTEACPGGGVFGVDLDQLRACEDCGSWEKCAAEVDRKERAK